MTGELDLSTVMPGVAAAVTRASSVAVTGGPAGGVPDAVAVLASDPASMSACVTVYVAVHVVDTPGANVATGHETADRPGNASDTPTDVSVTLPVFVTTNEYETVAPASVTEAGDTDLAMAIDGVRTVVTVSASVSVTVEPLGADPVTVAVFAIDPASMFACVTVYDAVQVVEAPGASDDTGQVTAVSPGIGSFTTTDVRSTLPVFVTGNEYDTEAPAVDTDAGDADFCTSIDGAGGAGGGTQAVLSVMVVSLVAVPALLNKPVPGPPQAGAAVYVRNRNVTASEYVWLAAAAMGVAAGASVNGPAPAAEPPGGAGPEVDAAVHEAPSTSRLGANAGVSVSAPYVAAAPGLSTASE